MNIFSQIEQKLLDLGFSFERTDFKRPWGGFFVINEIQASKFTHIFFGSQNSTNLINGRKVSPKILLVAPHKRLSWQYHFRRSEVWKIIKGTVGVIRSDTNEEQELITYQKDDIITLKKGERHRLVGLNDWAIIAEIWQHTNPNHLSDEEDIIRLQDDYGRK